MEPKTITNSQNLKRCVKSLQYYFLSGLFWLSGLPVQILSKNSGFQVVIRNYRASLAAYLTLRRNSVWVSLTEVWSNKRLLAGLLIIILSVPLWKFHLLFDVNDRSGDWYFQNFAFFFNNVKGYMSGTFVLIGFFIALPTKWKFKWWILPFVFFCVTEVYDRYSYDDYLDFQQVTPSWRMWGVFALCVPAVLFSMDYLLYRKYHDKDATKARVKGIIRLPGLPAETKIDILEQLVIESENFNARI